jgi:hypothetical protein
MAITQIQKLAQDVYKGIPVMYNNISGEEALKNLLLTSIGGEWNYYNFQKNKYDFYQVISEVLTLPAQETMTNIFDGIVKVDTIALGDKKVVDVENQDLFKVATVASGNSDIRRQRIFNKQVLVECSNIEIKIYDDFDRFVAGRINWATLIDRVRRSIMNDTAMKIYNTLLSAYDSTNANYNVTGVLNETTLDRMISRVEAKTGMKCALYGTKETLGKLSAGASSIVTTVHAPESLREDYASMGYFRNYKGTPMIEVPSILKAGTDTLAFGNELFILPIGMEIINVVYEGTPIVDDSKDFTDRNDRQIEFLFTQRLGVVCLVSGYFGIYKLQ